MNTQTDRPVADAAIGDSGLIERLASAKDKLSGADRSAVWRAIEILRTHQPQSAQGGEAVGDAEAWKLIWQKPNDGAHKSFVTDRKDVAQLLHDYFTTLGDKCQLIALNRNTAPAAQVDDAMVKRILATPFGLSGDTIAKYVRGDTMATGYPKTDVVLAIITAALNPDVSGGSEPANFFLMPLDTPDEDSGTGRFA